MSLFTGTFAIWPDSAALELWVVAGAKHRLHRYSSCSLLCFFGGLIMHCRQVGREHFGHVIKFDGLLSHFAMLVQGLFEHAFVGS